MDKDKTRLVYVKTIGNIHVQKWHGTQSGMGPTIFEKEGRIMKTVPVSDEDAELSLKTLEEKYPYEGR